MAGTLTIDTLKASSGVLATQNGMTGIAKAWVNFAGGTGTIANSFNVSSVTRTVSGVYTVSFTTTMPNANYVVAGSCGATNNGTTAGWLSNGAGNSGYTSNNTTTSCRVATNYVTAATADYEVVSVLVVGN